MSGEIKKIDFSKQGKRNKQAGLRFETRVRDNLMKLGWTVTKWSNTVEKNKEGFFGLVPAKRKYNPYRKAMVIGTGFPDFVCFKKVNEGFDAVGVEVKSNGYLDQIEKGMCLWLLENRIFSRILIAKKGKKRGEIIYDDFDKKYAHKFRVNTKD